MKPSSPLSKEVPLAMVGSAMFGRYDKISVENTFNMIIADNWLVPYAGYRAIKNIIHTGEGRGIYTSTIYNHMIMVIDNRVFQVSSTLDVDQIGTIDTFSGDVFISENNGGQIALCDKQNLYIFNYRNSTFQKITIVSSIGDGTFRPGYITFQDGYFITVNLVNNEWRLSDPNDGTQWPIFADGGATNVGLIETKPTNAIAAIRFPGKGNLLFVFGSTVTEPWYDTGAQLFPYQKNTYMNIDYGCLSAATIATEKDFIAWLGINEKAGPVIMISDGGEVKQLETDGINFRLARLVNPSLSYGFMFRQDGHIFYQITFPDPQDNLTLVYDFTTQKFFTLTDEYMNYHIAKRVAFFNDNYYFISLNDGDLYEMSTSILDYTYFNADGSTYTQEIPRVRVCKNIRLPDSSAFIINSLTFTMEQGQHTYDQPQRIDYAISNDGGETFTSFNSIEMNVPHQRRNRVTLFGLGYSNDFIPQFRFWGMNRFVITDGVITYYQ